MDVAQVLGELAERRLCIRIEGDRILILKGQLPPWLVDELRRNRRDVIETLSVVFDGNIPKVVDCSPPDRVFRSGLRGSDSLNK
jgi:hypothetical protein